MNKIIRILIGLCFFSYGNAQDKQYSFADLDAMNGQIQSMVYQQNSDTALKIYYRQPINVKGLKPAILFIHGGAWTGGSASIFFPYINYFSLRGMVGISIDYRLITKETDDIMNCISDCKAAIRFVKSHSKELGVDTNQIVLSGESAGGHLAACMVMLASNKLDNQSSNAKALVLYNPVLNLATPTFIKYLDTKLIKQKNLNQDSLLNIPILLSRAKSISPLFLSMDAVPRTLLINGTEDKITTVNFVEQFTQKLNQKGDCLTVLLPNTSHAFAVPHYKAPEETTVFALIATDNFLREGKYISGKPQIINANDPNWIIKR